MVSQTSISTTEISDKSRRDLLRLLGTTRGSKNLVLAKPLAGPIGLFVKFPTLKEHGVDRLFFLENDNTDSTQKNVFFLARADDKKSVISVAEQVKRLRHNGQVNHTFTIIWTPRRTLISDQILEEVGVMGDVTIFEYSLYFIPLSDDCLSLELDKTFGELYLKKDPTTIYLSAKALTLLQQKHGLFPRILGKGDNAKKLSDLLLRMRMELNAGDDSKLENSSFLNLNPSQSIESLIIIDRESDFPTSLLTQLTYEGLLDESFNITSNQFDIDPTILGTSTTAQGQSQGTKKIVLLDNNDQLYRSLRDSNCAAIGPILNKVARKLQVTYESRNTTGKTTSELREFVSKLPAYQAEHASLKLHTSLAEEVIKRTKNEFFSKSLEIQQNIAAGADPTTQHSNIEELIARDVSIETVLRLLCIYSCFSGGIRARDLEEFKRSIIQAYGSQHLITLNNLEKIGLLTQRSSNNPLGLGTSSSNTKSVTNYNQIRGNLCLIVDEVNESEPDDIAYTFSGYAPLSIRLVQCILQKSYLQNLISSGGIDPSKSIQKSKDSIGSISGLGWRPFDDTIKSIKGLNVDEIQIGEEKAIKARQILNGGISSTNNSGGLNEEIKTVIVFFLGGITRSEMSSLRFLNEQLKNGREKRKILICTTNVLTGESIMKEVIEMKNFIRIQSDQENE